MIPCLPFPKAVYTERKGYDLEVLFITLGCQHLDCTDVLPETNLSKCKYVF